ncbi:MAG TPA: PQQ-binding-like beta-propeller repeat protein [Vicinamibacterales bacterium]|nr:PQQ-binding-like beta-propeller repeat protein [Vicinamibacterales bacterium]
MTAGLRAQKVSVPVAPAMPPVVQGAPPFLLEPPLPDVPAMPAVAAGAPEFLLEAPSPIRWAVPMASAPMRPPVIAGGRVFVTSLPGILSAHDLIDGHQFWSEEMSPDHPVVADVERVYVAAGEAVHALRAQDRAVAWRTPTGTLTAPPLGSDGWVIVAPAGRTVALRAADGAVVWSRENGTQRVRPALAGDTLIVALTDGRIQALDLKSGNTKWERRLGGIPAEALVVGDRVYVGASDKYFYCLKLASGSIDWRIRVGAALSGTPTSDGDRVYFTALDNLVRAVTRVSGAQLWQRGVPFRPFSGPMVAGGSVLVAGPVSALRLLHERTGRDVRTIAFPEPLVNAPVVGAFNGEIVVVGVTGGLNESWQLMLASPPPWTWVR